MKYTIQNKLYNVEIVYKNNKNTYIRIKEDGTIYVTYYYDKNIGTGDIEPPQTGLDFGRISTSQIEIVLYRKEEE